MTNVWNNNLTTHNISVTLKKKNPGKIYISYVTFDF